MKQHIDGAVANAVEGGSLYKKFAKNELIFNITTMDHGTHLGLDIQADLGANVYALRDGEITNITTNSFLGFTVTIDCGNGLEFAYCNLSTTLPAGIDIGTSVTTGQVIGFVGNTATGESEDPPHLHLEVSENGTKVDPLNYLLVYEPTCSVSVVDGVINEGITSGSFKATTQITLRCDNLVDNSYFFQWEDASGEVISDDSSCKVIVTSDNIYTAVYKENPDIIEKNIDTELANQINASSASSEIYAQTILSNNNNEIGKINGGNLSINGTTSYLVTSPDGNTYFEFRPVKYDTSFHSHINWQATDRPAYIPGKYMIIDFDYFSDSAHVRDAYLNIISRTEPNEEATPISGANTNFTSLDLPTGEWVHLTLIADYANNMMYIYANGIYTTSITNGVYRTTDWSEIYFEGLKINSSNKSNVEERQSLAIDNVFFRTNIDIDQDLIEASSILSWEDAVYNGDYSLPQVEPILYIDSVPCYSVSEANSLLKGEEHHIIIPVREFNGTLVIGCNALVINRDLAVSILPASGVKTSIDANGNTEYALAKTPSFVANGTMDSTTIGNATRYDVMDNLYTGPSSMQGTTSSATEGYTNSYLGTNSDDGNMYCELIANGVTDTTNSYFEVRVNKLISYDPSVTQFFVYDFDLARLNNEYLFNFTSVTRSENNSTAYWANNFSTRDELYSLEGGVFYHFTAVYDVNTGRSFLFINNKLVADKAYGFVNMTGMDLFLNGSTLNHNGMRFGQNSPYVGCN